MLACFCLYCLAESPRSDLPLLELDRSAIERILNGFNPQGEQLVELQRQLEALDSSEFLVRDRAMKDLLLRPVIPPDLMDEISKAGSTEVRLAVRRLRASHSPERIDLLLRSVYTAIDWRSIEGLCSEVLKTLPFAVHSSTRRLGEKAIASTAQKSDAAKLRTALSAKSPVIRRTAATVLADVVGEKAGDDLLPLTKDTDANVRLDAAIALGNVGRRESLGPLVKLLQHDVFAIRWKASEALVALTGQSHEYNPAAAIRTRKEAIERWRLWLQKNQDSASLTTPIVVPAEIVLFNGSDLTGWTAYREGKIDASDVWMVSGGNLNTIPKKSGDLRTNAAFEDYRLTLEFRMPSAAGDSGVGVCLQDANARRPVYLEVQLHPNNCGDLYVINGLQAWAAGQPVGFRAVKWKQSNERYQQWNKMEVIVAGGTARVAINGEMQNQADKLPAGASHVLLRNEGSKVEFREIILEPLE